MARGRLYQALWGRVFATVYDRLFVGAERDGFAAVRAEVASRASGRVLEVGAGTGLNLAHYPPAVKELILAEPDRHMAGRLRRKMDADRPGLGGPVVTLIEAPAERLPVEDASVDAVVCTLVLCSAPEPSLVLAEVARVLRPGGIFSFAEHVRAADPGLARWQDRLNRPWGWCGCGCGCNCNRDTVAAVRSSPLQLEELRADQLRGIGPLVRPLAVGVAVSSRAAASG